MTENGVVDPIRQRNTIQDTFRVAYHEQYLAQLRLARDADGVDVRGYFVWSLLDNVEWGDGLRDTFGLYYVERPSLRRVAKSSCLWLRKYIAWWRESDGPPRNKN